MLKHALSANNGLTNGGVHRHHVSQDPRGYTDVRMTELPPNGSVRTYRSPPPGLNHTYAGHPSLNLSTASSNLHSRSFNLGNNNPYSNTSTLSNSKHSLGGGTSASVSPHGPAPHSLPNGGLHISRQGAVAPPPPASFVDGTPRHPPSHHHPHHPYANTHGLNVSALSTSKHSLGGNSSSVSPLGMASLPGGRVPNGGLNISRVTVPSMGPPAPPLSPSVMGGGGKSLTEGSVGTGGKEAGVREMLTSLGLLCLVSLLLALLSLVFMLKISPVTAADVKDFLRSDQVTVISPEEYVLVYEVTLALCALSLSLNLCCLLVCAVQFLFAVKLVRDSPNGERTNKYLKKSSFTRVCAVGGFFVSIPVFLTGIILYTFIQFHSTPAVITSVLIGLGIIFCGCAMVHNVFIWQKEKTHAVRAMAQQQRLALQRQQSLTEQSRLGAHTSYIHNSGSTSSGQAQHQTLDLSNDTPTPPEICTLV